ILCGTFLEKLEGFADNLTSATDPKLTFPPKLVLVDFGDMNSMPDVIAETLECCGCVDVLILNSSLKVKAPVQSTSLKMDKLVMDNNYFGPITRRTGHVILVNSIQGKLAMPFRATYAASKHAVQAFFDCLRAEVQEYGISVSTILNSKKREVAMAHSLPKMSIYARSLFPNVFFAVMVAGVNNAAGVNNIAALADSEEL
uniref:Dehydrogenase/reductase (SDR family) member 7Ca n=1 Tax=Oncorhynchus kisutch TaxID=8019 RepID=A0A8C7CXG2_ONCKI